jgi:hypothetical protein
MVLGYIESQEIEMAKKISGYFLRRRHFPCIPRKFPYFEKFIVVPAKSGFVAFRCKSRPDMAAQYEGVFRKVIDSFSVLESAG